MGVTCGAYGGRERGVQGSGGEIGGKNHWGDPDEDVRIILKWFLRK